MTAYQLYFLDDDDRDVARQDHVCADDRAAIRMGRSLCFEHHIDIWNGARRVARIPRGNLALPPLVPPRTIAWR
jgi:hypothetical protein